MARKFLFLLASAREGGNTVALARRAAQSLPPDAAQDWRDLTGALPPFEDHRHDAGYGPLSPRAQDMAEATMACSDLVFVAPLYWYGLPAPAKLYLDHWSHWMRRPELDLKARMRGKDVWLVMAHSGSTPAEIAPALDCLRLSCDYLAMQWHGALLTDANAPGDWQRDEAALAQAARFFTT